MNRRKFVVGATGIATATGLGLALTGSAAASTDATFDANEIAGTSADGVVEAVLVNVTGTFAFEGLDTAATNAIISLEARDKSDDSATFEAFDETTVTPPSTQATEGVDFGTLEGDLLTLEQFDASDFSEGEDGETNRSNVELRLSVLVEYGTNGTVDTESKTTLDVAMTNLDAAASADALADGQLAGSHHIGVSPDGVMDVRAIYADDETVAFRVSLTDEWDKSADPANWNLNFDIGGAGAAEDYQVGWHASGAGGTASADPPYSDSPIGPGGFIKVADGSSRELFHADETDMVDVRETDDPNTFIATIEGVSLPDEYGFAGFASDGGDSTHVITIDNETPDWTAAENFRTVPVPDEPAVSSDE